MAESELRLSQRVFNEGPFAQAAKTAQQAAFDLMENDSLFDVEINPEPSDISVNPYGRGGFATIHETSETNTDDEGREIIAVTVEVSPPEYVPADIVDAIDYDVEVDLRRFYDESASATTKLELLAVDERSLESNILFILQCVLATGYMAGRRDQILDMFGSNDQRFVKAEDLGPVLDIASDPTNAEYGIFTQFSADRNRTIEALKSLRGILKDQKDSQPDLAIGEIDYEQQVAEQILREF